MTSEEVTSDTLVGHGGVPDAIVHTPDDHLPMEGLSSSHWFARAILEAWIALRLAVLLGLGPSALLAILSAGALGQILSTDPDARPAVDG